MRNRIRRRDISAVPWRHSSCLPSYRCQVEVLTDEIKRRLKDKFNIMVMDFCALDKKDGEEEAFFDPNENHISQINSVLISKSFRVILLQVRTRWIRGMGHFVNDCLSSDSHSRRVLSQLFPAHAQHIHRG